MEEAKQLLLYAFSPETASMTKQEFIDELKEYIKVFLAYKPLYVFGSMVDFGFIITPDVQEWVNENLFTQYQKNGFRKIAIALSKEIFSQISIEQTMEESNATSFETRFFDSREDALAWLSEK